MSQFDSHEHPKAREAAACDDTAEPAAYSPQRRHALKTLVQGSAAVFSGIALEGVRRILELENTVAALRMRVAELEEELTATQFALQNNLPKTTNPNLPAVRSASQAVTVWRRRRY